MIHILGNSFLLNMDGSSPAEWKVPFDYEFWPGSSVGGEYKHYSPKP